ncbi:glycosyltransferase family 4 protein [Providencia hangzhouensis]
MCADASHTWKDKKYTFINKVGGYILSRIIRLLLANICRNKNTINLCTGDILEKFSKKHSPLKTYQFVDLMSKKSNLINENQTSRTNESKLFRLAFVGRLVEDKGIFDLLNAVKNQPKNVMLNIVGGGESYEEVIAFINKNKLNDRVFIHGQLSFHELAKIYKETDLTIVPSNNYYEGFPRVIMESWSYGIPVIVSNVGGINAFVKDRVNGLIMQPGDTKELEELISLAINNKDIYRSIKNGATDMVEYSSFEYWSDKMLSIIKENNNEA